MVVNNKKAGAGVSTRIVDKFKSKESLNQKQNNRGAVLNKQFKCEVCLKVFPTQQQQTIHMRTHTGERPYSCPTCHRRFSHQSTVKKHEYIHLKEKNYKCPVCVTDRFFRSPHALRAHMVFHQEKIHQCLLCDKKFYTRSSLKEHQKVHTRVIVKPFECQFCKKKFTHSTCLKNHIRTHNKEIDFKCHLCGKKFIYPKNLRKHVKSHARKISFRCETCKEVFKNKCQIKKHRCYVSCYVLFYRLF